MTDAVEPSSPRFPARRRRRRRIVLLALLLFGVWLTRWVYLHITLRPTPRPEYWIEQIERLDPPPPGAYSYDQAVQILKDASQEIADLGIEYKELWREDRLRQPDDWTAWSHVFASEGFAKVRETLAALGGREWRPEKAGYENLAFFWTPMYMPMVTCTRVLLDHARWSWANNGQVSTVLEDWRTVASLARSSGRSRCSLDHQFQHLLSHLLAYAMTEWAIDALHRHSVECGVWRGLAGQEFCTCPLIGSRAWALEIERIMGPELPADEYCAGERMRLVAMLECIYVREGGDWLDVSEAVRWVLALDRSASPAQIPAPTRIWNVLSPVFDSFSDAVGAIDASLVYPKCAVDLPATKAVDDAHGIRHAIGPLQGWPGCPYYPAISGVMASMYSVRCHMNAALTCLAIRDFHLSRGRFPNELNELVPAFLPRLPIDYGDRQVLRYRREGVGFVLYSVGWNGVDDGGVSLRPDHEFDERNLDIVFVTYP